ncbi:primosomal protein N' (replication factor Y) (superfamily II helicase) [Ketogulonicigenium robustum]|uniref:Replication restart protein PriA n=1 Tax=Ketogulonicigenium robustum TaxID=92947 RepID=A0A1W6NXP4_9RHOB|nr:primosomal protein N' [Ketogulonicigenium robustum]ARO13933.1 primosomal protein N' (replication factor Y) (superfamily II helicase) [Ketogulonicigenium robustum]
MQPDFSEGALVSVLTTQPIDRMLDYRAPEGGCDLGALVEVPLGPRKVLGVVWGAGQGNYDLAKVRAITRLHDAPPLRDEMRRFLEKVADYTLSPLHQMLRMTVRAPQLDEATRLIYRATGQTPDRMTPARQAVLSVMADFSGLAFTLGELAEAAGVTPSVIKGMVKAGALAEEVAPRDLPFPRLDPAHPSKTLTEDQADAAAKLRQSVASGQYGTTLLKGVTGSGKTEVYLEAVAEALRQGRQALVLLPEIALSGEFLRRVEERFGARPAEWHSGITMTERRRVWKMIGTGDAQVVVGARSALFLPFQDLGLVVVDEEHDGSYKQGDGVLYNARDMAVLRASLNGGHVVLASATPSLETWANADSGKYARIDLHSRFGVAVMPDMHAIDMRAEKLAGGHWISPTLQGAVLQRLQRGEQSLLFLNRRGFAPVTLCRACGQQVACEECDARMVEHRFLNRLVCHQCGAQRPVPDACPSCGVEGKMVPVGPGVERLEEEAKRTFPEARVVVLSSDLFGTARALKERIAEIADGGADIIIGTQIVAKGHNFPNLTLVGVIDADLGLQGSDLRAAEKTFQLMRQVAGRAGRAAAKGVALLQTYQPEHPVLRAILSGDDEGFWQAEADQRRAAGVPPYGRMAGIIISSPDLQAAFDIGNRLQRAADPLRARGIEVYGPAPAPIARVRGRHRVRLLVKAAKSVHLQAALAQWCALPLPPEMRLTIDIDPQSFL